MAKKKAALVPLTDTDKAEVLRIIQAADQPLDVSKVGKLGAFSRPAKPAELTELLDLLVCEQLIDVFAATTKTGKPKYWDRDPHAIVQQALEQLVQQSSEPLTSRQVKSLLKLPFNVNDAEREQALQRAMQSQLIFSLPPKTANGGARYFGRSPLEYGRDCLLAELGKKGALAEAALRKAIAWLPQDEQVQVIDQLRQSGGLFAHPAIGTGKSKAILWGLQPPAPEPYLAPIRKLLASITEQLRGAEVSEVDLRRAVAAMVESVGISFGALSGMGHENQPAMSTGASVDLMRLMSQVDSRATRGALITARVLRRAAGLKKAEFDHLAIQLARQGQIDLHEHDFPASLSTDEREELITDGQGRFYVGMAIRT